MRATAALFVTLLVVFVLAVPAIALEDGIMETTSSTPNEDSTHADFERVITNPTESAIDITPRDLRMAEYPIMDVTSITVGTFDDGIWTVGTLEPGQTAKITYTGDAAPATTTAASSAATTTTATEELPHTGQRDDLAVFAFAGLALIGLGVSLLRATRD